MVLEDHRALRTRPGNFAVVANQPAFRRQGDPGDKVQQRRFTAAGVANQADGFALVDIKETFCSARNSPLAVEKRWLTAWT
jgi:hypothetical protein